MKTKSRNTDTRVSGRSRGTEIIALSKPVGTDAQPASSAADAPVTRGGTERKNIKSGRDRHQIFLDNIQDACVEINPNGKCTFCNEAAHQMLGYSREEYMNLRHRQRYATKTEADKVLNIFKEVYHTGVPAKLFESDVRRKDGSVITMEMMISPILTGRKGIAGFRGVGRDITARKETQDILRQSEAHYRSLFEHTKAIMFLIDPDTGRFVDVNLTACSYYGYSKKEFLQKKITDINTLNEDDVRQKMLMAKSEQRSHFYFTHRLACGALRPVEVFTSPVEIGGRKLLYSIIHDITERREAEEALRHSEEKYRTIIENMQDAYFECDLSGTFIFANKAASDTMGYTPDELLKLDYRAFTRPATSKKVKEVFQHTFETGIPCTLFDYEIVLRDKTTRIHQLNVGLMRDTDGHPVGFRVVSRDVTERKRAEEELRASEEKYRSILENMTEGYFESGIRGRITFANDAACAMMGYTREQLLNIHYRQFTTPETRKRITEAYRQVYQTGLASKLGDYEIIRGDGSIRTHQLSIGLMKDAAGGKTGFRAVARDITESKQAEEALRHSEERIRVLFNNIPVPTVVWKGYKNNLILMEYNDAALQYTGGKILEAVGKTVEECYPNAPHIAADMHQCFSLQTHIEKSFWFRDGHADEKKYVTIKYAFAPPDNVIMHVNDMTAQKKAEENLKHISIHDALTGLYNRFYSDAEISRIKSSRLRPVSFIVMDLNNLKVVNDEDGHAAGDLCIKNTANLLKQAFRPEDMIARIGGDEFIIMLPLVDEETCAQALTRLKNNVAQFNLNAARPISLAAGFSTARAGDDIEALIAKADRRMYQEKARMKAVAGNEKHIP